MSGSSQDWTAGDLRKALIKRASNGAPPEVLSAPSKETAITLADFIYYYDSSDPDMPDDARESEFYQLMMSRLETLTALDAVRSGDISSMRGIAGSQYEENTVDAGQLEWVDFVDHLVKPDDRHHMMNLAITSPPPPEGPTGVGKSYTAYSIIETLQYISDITFASNNDTDPFDTVTSWTDLEEWLDETEGQKLFLWDEAAQVLMYDDQVSGVELAKLIRLLRKYNCHLILIGHTGMGIPKDPRRMLSFIQKVNQESAIYGVGLEEAKNGWMEITKQMNRIENIPPTKIVYDDIGDEGEFEFDLGQSEESVDTDLPDVDTTQQVAVIDYLSSDESLRTVADRHDVSHEGLRKWVNEYDDEFSEKE